MNQPDKKIQPKFRIKKVAKMICGSTVTTGLTALADHKKGCKACQDSLWMQHLIRRHHRRKYRMSQRLKKKRDWDTRCKASQANGMLPFSPR